MNIFAQNILNHYQCPRHRGEMPAADASGRELNRSCGDEMTVYVKIKDGLVSAISFTGKGCAISTAAISILSEELIGLSKNEILKMDIDDIRKLLGIEISWRREKCALIGLRALQGALRSLGSDKL